MIFDNTHCQLGEGALWHPLRQTLLWFDINTRFLFERRVDIPTTRTYRFDNTVSAAGIIDERRIIIASDKDLFIFDLHDKTCKPIIALEADNPRTRSNDGRVDRQGGFWIGTMGRGLESGAGAIYRYYRGQLRRLYAGLTVPNAICFAPDGGCAYFADTPTHQIMRVALDAEGWPCEEPQVFVDLRGEALLPDGAIIDAAGNLWNAQWGAGRVACYDTNGRFVAAHKVPAVQATCPAFGGGDMARLFITSAAEGMAEGDVKQGQAGFTFELTGVGVGVDEPVFSDEL